MPEIIMDVIVDYRNSTYTLVPYSVDSTWVRTFYDEITLKLKGDVAGIVMVTDNGKNVSIEFVPEALYEALSDYLLEMEKTA